LLKNNKYFLITCFKKINFKNKNYVFYNEFLEKLYSEKILKKINYKNFISIQEQNSLKINQKFLKKKLLNYRIFLSEGLNNIHSEEKNIKYWGIIIDYYLIFLILITKINYDYYEIIKKRLKNLAYTNSTNNYTFENSGEFVHYIVGDNNFLNYLRDQIITKGRNDSFSRQIFIPIRNKKIDFISELLFYIIRNIAKLYIFLRKPVVLVNCYFGKENSLKLFIKSFGKILNIPRHLLFSDKKLSKSKNICIREKLLFYFEIKDDFDIIIKKILKDCLPLSFIENFSTLKNKNKTLPKLKKIGSAVDLYDNDEFKIYAADHISSGGSVAVYKHGGISEKEIVNPLEMINSIYANKIYEWQDKRGLGDNFLSNLNTVKIENIKRNNQILFFCSNSNIYERYSPVIKFCNHSRLNIFYEFYENLSFDYKKKCLIRLFPRKESLQIKKIWQQKFSNNLKFDNGSKMIAIKNSKIVILDDYSTPIYELVKMDVPFILVTKDSLNNFKPKFIRHIKNLKKIGLIYDSVIEGAKFINKNYKNIDIWWSKILENKNYKNFKNNLFSSSPNYLNNIKEELLNDI
jgi:putative transferase (TIGR04331 family)